MLTVFVALTFVAIAIQAGVLVALYVAVKRSSERMEAVATQIQTRALPVLEQTSALLQETAPRLREITINLAETTSTVKEQVFKIDSTITEVMDRSRTQIIRIDEMVAGTLDKIEMTTQVLEMVAMNPVKKVTGILGALQVGLSTYLGKRRRNAARAAGAADDEDLFI